MRSIIDRAESDARTFRSLAASLPNGTLARRYLATAERREAVALALRSQLAEAHTASTPQQEARLAAFGA